MDRLPSQQPPALRLHLEAGSSASSATGVPLRSGAFPLLSPWATTPAPGAGGAPAGSAPELREPPTPRRCRTVATTSPSSSGPTTSWMAMIRSARVMERDHGLASPRLPLPTVVTACRSITVAMSSPPAEPLHCCTRRGSIPCALGLYPEHVCGMVRPPEAMIGPSGCMLLTSGKIGYMHESCLNIP